ncbi:MAG TPA: Gfo/Idh/MocA family oxidoreductase [Egibacteraceae bacterium]|nr:Gfo/Idh/MocA family oxidoreductase [Egibacteraceae bacterium]
MRIALVGLGDIARKAYLPLLAARADLELCLVTRDKAALDELGDAYRISQRHTSLSEALGAGIDAAFVHAATTAHHELVTSLLTHRIPVYVDKPLDLHLGPAEEMVATAQQLGVSLMVGFNRRYAPSYRELADWPDRRIVILQKNRMRLPEPPRQVVFDDFVHVIDTLRFLGVSAPDDLDVTAQLDADGALEHLVIQLRAGGRAAIGIMSRTGGITEEVLEVMGRDRKRRVVNVAEITHYEGSESIIRRDEWRSVADQRGFTAICDEFLGAVGQGRLLSAEDALATHRLCERIVTEIMSG